MARKTAFVNDMILQTLKQHQQVVPSIVKTITKLDDKIKDILENDQINEHRKLQLYSQALQQYMNTRRNLKIDTETTPISTPLNPSGGEIEQVKNNDPYTEESIIETIPRTLRAKAKNLLKFIKVNNKINWNDSGVVTYNDEEMKNSNIIDLVNDVIRPRKSSQPNNWREFANALHQLNIPKDLIGNPKRKDISPVSSNIKWKQI